MLKKTVSAIVLTCLFSQSCLALFGVRPLGMGGAFTAVANDASTQYYNPAGLALNPEVAIQAYTMINNRNRLVGDNIGHLKMCYEAEMDPFAWMLGVGVASWLTYEGAKYLGNQGVLKTGWGRPGKKTVRGESMAKQVEGSKEVVSLREKIGEAGKRIFTGKKTKATKTQRPQKPKSSRKVIVKERVIERHHYLTPWRTPWYNSSFHHHTHHQPRYFEPSRPAGPKTKAQFALGLSWLNDYNPPNDEKANWYSLAIASGFEQRVALGANINIYNLQKISTGTRGFGGDLDFGFLAKPVPALSLGLVTKGILTSDIYWQDNSKTRYEMLVNAGIAFNPLPFLTLAADIHNVLGQNNNNATNHYGAEVNLMPGLIVRGGLDDNNKTAGLSLALNRLTLDYAILGGSYNRSQMLGASWIF